MKRTIMAALAACLLMNTTLLLADDDLQTVASSHDATTTMDRFEQAVISAGFDVFARIDHQQNAKAAGLEMDASQLLVFGKPKAGTLMMQANPRIGLALPLKVLVWEDNKGKVWLSYQKPADLLHDFNIEGHDKMASNIAMGLAKLSGKATQK